MIFFFFFLSEKGELGEGLTGWFQAIEKGLEVNGGLGVRKSPARLRQG